jgi:ribonuclease P protein component
LGQRYEADIQSPQSEAGQQARVSRAHEDEGWAQDPEPSSEARPVASRREDRREVASERTGRSEGLPREARIRLGSEIRELLERGKRKRTKDVDVFFAASPASRSRLGLIVPKHGHRIVDRNRVKRRLREIGRRTLLPALEEAGVRTDVLLRARRTAYEADFVRLERQVKEVVEDLCSQES